MWDGDWLKEADCWTHAVTGDAMGKEEWMRGGGVVVRWEGVPSLPKEGWRHVHNFLCQTVGAHKEHKNDALVCGWVKPPWFSPHFKLTWEGVKGIARRDDRVTRPYLGHEPDHPGRVIIHEFCWADIIRSSLSVMPIWWSSNSFRKHMPIK